MSDIATRLDETLKTAMRSKDQATLNIVRMLKTRMMERKTTKGFTGEVNDALWLELISAYSKSMEKAVGEFEKAATEGARAQITELKWEIAFCQTWLPKKADDGQTSTWVDEAIAGLGGKEKAKIGAVMGAVMKGHKDDVDAATVKRLAELALA
ncbi:MAG: hypothetical protein EXR76_06265 [Myxococcales bacterium]|nr:hypothetical protein [Myxococcales bacterium]